MAQAKASRRAKRPENSGAAVADNPGPVTPAVRRIVIIRDGQFVPPFDRGSTLKAGR
jgi:hypothetical protein